MKAIQHYTRERQAAQNAADAALHQSKSWAVQNKPKQAKAAHRNHRAYLKCVKFAEKRIAKLIGMSV